MKSNFIQLKEITDKEFHLFRDIIYKESGISLSDQKKTLMQSRLMKRLRVLKLKDYMEYYNYFQSNYQTELINLLNCITTNKTDFFREDKHFDFILNTALPEFEKKQRKKIQIWSAGCSTGQEPYSIAMTICDFYDKYQKPVPDINILATDLDTEALKTGTAGIYKGIDLDEMDKNRIKRYFTKESGDNDGFYKINDPVIKLVNFRRLNLLDKTYPMKEQFDMIFCRNVIIYFDNVSRLSVFEKFYNYLIEDGYFFAGHSENIRVFFNGFTLLGNTIYKKNIR